ncbi:MAG: hypothetical protein AAGE80_09055 [Pseudomonadota bacterium]
MHAVVRLYSGPGAGELFDLLETRKREVEDLISSVSGFRSYILIKGPTGGASVTVCETRFGTEESMKLARDWIVHNAYDLNLAAPTVADGEVILEA